MVKRQPEPKSRDRVMSPQNYIFIFGPNHLQNKLLLNFLQEKTKCTCNSIGQINPSKLAETDPACRYLFMVDSKNDDVSSMWETLLNRHRSNLEHCLFALYNVDQGMEIETEALERGIHGIFYNEDGLDSLAKGAIAILKGELWFSRKLMSQSLMKRKKNRFTVKDESNDLTYREKEILTRLVTGASNKQIAENLCISPHTVKTHIYNVYKKLGINNRLQATLWAAKHL